MALLPVEIALESILKRVVLLPEETVGIEAAIGRSVAKTVVAARTLPPSDSSAMDGYAVRSVDATGPGVRLKVIERIFAGDRPKKTIGAGECARIMTGAYLPPGADAVLMQEKTKLVTPFPPPPVSREVITTRRIEESGFTDYLSKQYGVPAISLDEFKVDLEVLKQIPGDIALRHLVMPLKRAGPALIIAMSDPSNIQVVDDLRFLTGLAIEPVVASEPTIRAAIERYYGLENELVELLEAVPKGAAVRRAGEDTQKGAPLLTAGTVIGIPEAGLLWSQGLSSVTVRRRPRVAIASTGDELCAIGEEPGERIFDTNSPSIAAAVRRAGGEPTILGLAPDRLEDVKALFARGLDFDVLITSAGASVGERDFAREALESIGVQMDFWKVAMKPGKPLAVGHRGAMLVFGLPGNPTSSLVSFELFARPALRALQGLPPVTLALLGRTAVPLKKTPGLRNFIRATVESKDGELWATPLSTQSSGSLTSAASATHLISVPPETTALAVGDRITLIPVSWIG